MSPSDQTIELKGRRPELCVNLDRFGFVLVEHAAVPLLFIDDDLRVLYANHEARLLFGDEAAALDSMLIELLPGLKDVDPVHWGVAEGFQILDEISRISTQLEASSQNRSFMVEIDARPACVEGCEGRVLVVRDMTEQNDSMRSIFRAHRELEDFNRISVGRELRMIELKEEVNQLLEEQGKKPRYVIES